MKSLTKIILCTLCAATCIQQQLYPWSFFSFLHGASKGASIAPTIESNPSYVLPIIIGISLCALVVIAIAAAFSKQHSGVLFQKATVFETNGGHFGIVGITHNAKGWFVQGDLFSTSEDNMLTYFFNIQNATQEDAEFTLECALNGRIKPAYARSHHKHDRKKTISNQHVEISLESLKRILYS